MPNIVCISASVRTGRKSHRVALFFRNYIEQHNLGTVDILDLNNYQFPIFNERLRFLKDPPPAVLETAQKIADADGVIIVTPEYNGGYPASLKNFIDLLYSEWKRKPIAIATVSDGMFGGTQVITSLLFSLWKIGAWMVPSMYPVPKAPEAYTEDGEAVDKTAIHARAEKFVGELLWCIEAKKRMN